LTITINADSPPLLSRRACPCAGGIAGRGEWGRTPSGVLDILHTVTFWGVGRYPADVGIFGNHPYYHG